MNSSYLIAVALVVGMLQPAEARVWAPPEGCEIFLTVQSKGCRVSHHYQCERDAPGHQWRADLDQEGMFFRSLIDSETQWVESHEIDPPLVQILERNPLDPASFSELIATGEDQFDFTLRKSDGTRSNVTGFDRLTGRTITIDGILLEETEYAAVEVTTDGLVVQNSRGHEYISREFRLFFSGQSQVDLGDGNMLPLDGSPMQLIRKGEKGFGSSNPIYDCDPVITQAPQAPAGLERLWRARYGE